LAYDLKMRRFFLWFLLCLMPLRLWAGAWMPMAQTAAHLGPQSLSVTHVAQAVQAPTQHDCHEAAAKPAPEAHASAAMSIETTAQKSDCQDGTCQLCGVCHQSASLPAWPVLASIFQSHALPVGAALTHVARTAPPLTKPPIS